MFPNSPVLVLIFWDSIPCVVCAFVNFPKQMDRRGWGELDPVFVLDFRHFKLYKSPNIPADGARSRSNPWR